MKTSKAALIRNFVRSRISRLARDPITTQIGAFDVEPGEIDEVVYGSRDSSTPRSGPR